MTKDTVLETVQGLPQEFELEELIERLIFIEKVNIGLEQVNQGKTISQNELSEEIKEWQK